MDKFRKFVRFVMETIMACPSCGSSMVDCGSHWRCSRCGYWEDK